MPSGQKTRDETDVQLPAFLTGSRSRHPPAAAPPCTATDNIDYVPLALDPLDPEEWQHR